MECGLNKMKWHKGFSPPTNQRWYQVLRGILVIAGGFLVHLSLGTVYTIGNVAPYIVSYVRNQSHPQDLMQGTTTWIFACILIGIGGAMLFGGWMGRKIGPRWATLIGGWLMSFGVAVTYFTIRVSFWLLLLTYGLLHGVGVGIAYIGPLAVAMKWLPRCKGLAVGIVVSGFGLGALIFNAVQTVYVNPDNLEAQKAENGEEYFVDLELLHRVPFLFLILGGTYAVMQLVGSLLITNPPEDYISTNTSEEETPMVAKPGLYREVDDDSCKSMSKAKKIKSSKSSVKMHRSLNTTIASSRTHSGKRPPDDEKAELLKDNTITYSDTSRENSPERDSDESSTSSSDVCHSNAVVSLKPSQMLRKPSFYMLWFILLASNFVLLFTTTLYKFFGLQVGFDDHFLAIVGSVSAIFNCLGRIVWGAVADSVSYKFALVLILGIMTIFLLTLYICTLSVLSIAGHKALFFVWICVLFFCIGGNFSVFPMAIARAFGVQYVSVNYGLLFTSEAIAGSVGAFLATVLKVHLGFSGLFFLVSGLSAAGFILAIVYRPKRYISLEPS